MPEACIRQVRSSGVRFGHRAMKRGRGRQASAARMHFCAISALLAQRSKVAHRDMSENCLCTKSLRFSPLCGSRSACNG